MNIFNKYITSYWYVWTPNFKIKKESKRWNDPCVASSRYTRSRLESHLFKTDTYMSLKRP